MVTPVRVGNTGIRSCQRPNSHIVTDASSADGSRVLNWNPRSARCIPRPEVAWRECMKIFLGQINPTVGALEANYELIREVYEQGVRAGADLVLVPELAITGYPPRDLLDKKVFVDRNLEIRDRLVGMTHETALDIRLRHMERGTRQAFPQHGRRGSAGRCRSGAAQDASAYLRRVRRAPLLRAGD